MVFWSVLMMVVSEALFELSFEWLQWEEYVFVKACRQWSSFGWKAVLRRQSMHLLKM